MLHPVVKKFLERQRDEALDLARRSDVLTLETLDLQRYVARFRARSTFRAPGGEVLIRTGSFEVGILLPESYLIEVDGRRVLTWLAPTDVFLPNVRPPKVCLDVPPATPLIDILCGLYELITYQLFATLDGLNGEAMAWAVSNSERLPLARRGLLPRSVLLQTREVSS